jgi:hypothetical protein
VIRVVETSKAIQGGIKCVITSICPRVYGKSCLLMTYMLDSDKEQFSICERLVTEESHPLNLKV